jgi:hypothetical protein
MKLMVERGGSRAKKAVDERKGDSQKIYVAG